MIRRQGAASPSRTIGERTRCLKEDLHLHLQPLPLSVSNRHGKEDSGKIWLGLLRDLPQSLLNYFRAPKGCEAVIATQSFPGGWYWASDMQTEWEKRGSVEGEGSQEPLWAVIENLGNWESRERICERKQHLHS